ncbi:hypothetical protein M5D96_012265 [Drosophila gunungcola]|uniref:Uncharacterized protein n=1 Tax=Drosophila gunungcola TaxID=103775 RepID=A0A9P9YDQ2_9MUSC|nr:hypothetical protein M5D96_012265 [Drosophila gunungcola]
MLKQKRRQQTQHYYFITECRSPARSGKAPLLAHSLSLRQTRKKNQTVPDSIRNGNVIIAL